MVAVHSTVHIARHFGQDSTVTSSHWIILTIDRVNLGAPVLAHQSGKHKGTADPSKAARFKSRRSARAAANKILGKPQDRYGPVLYAISEVDGPGYEVIGAGW